MALAMAFELRIEERSPCRVVVSVLLAPVEGAARVDGVALQLHNRVGEALGVQMVLPIAGELRNAMLSTVELKLEQDIPQGSRVVGIAWAGPEQREASIPTDPFTELEVHMRFGRRIGAAAEDRSGRPDLELDRLEPEEREVLARDFPWIDEPRVPSAVAQLAVMDHEEPQDLSDMVDELGLDAESASWLKELLEEDDLVHE